MRVFVAVLEQGSLASAARKLGRSPAAVSRAIAFLETQLGAPLLHRTTRSLKLSEAGTRYATACKRILADLQEADLLVAQERAAPRGTLTVAAPVAAGEELLGPLIDQFLADYPELSLRLLLLDRPVNLIDEGIDVTLRIAHLPDSSLVALPLGEVRRVLAVAPAYLAARPAIAHPSDLAGQRIVAMTHFGSEAWSFHSSSAAPLIVPISPALAVNSIRAARASAMAGHGVTRLFSYHVAEQVAGGSLSIVLTDFEPPPLPVQLLTPQGRLSMPKVRAFVDFAVPRLRAEFARLSKLVAGA